jgi:ribosomal protein S18
MISAQGKLFSRVRSNLEAKSQRKLRRAVHRARNMALLPFVGR